MKPIDIQFEELNEDIDISFADEVEIPKGFDESKNALKTVANSYGGEILDETPFSEYAGIFEEIIEERAETVTAELEKTKEELTETLGLLSATENELTATAGELSATKATLETTRGELAETEAELLETENELAETQSRKEYYMSIVDRTVTKIEESDVEFMTEIPAYWCYQAKQLASVELPDHMKRIMDRAFNGCSAMKHLKLPSNIEVISIEAFSGCAFEKLTIPSSIKEPKAHCFGYNYSLKEVHADFANVSFSGIIPFSNCSELEIVDIKNIKGSFTVGTANYGDKVTVESLIGLCAECINVGSARTFTMNDTNLAKLANVYVRLLDDDGSGKMPFEVCESTDEGAYLIEDYMQLKNWEMQ